MRIKRILAGMLAAVTIIAGSIPASGVQAEAATNWSVYSDDYFYNKMNASEKKLYSGMTSAANKAMESSDNITEIKAPYSGLTIEQLTNVLRIWTETEAQYFFISNSVHYSYSTGSGSGRDISEIGKTDDTASNTDTGKSSDTVKKDTSSYKVTVSPKSVTLKKGARKGISYSTHSPSALTKVTWSSCNKKVAAVSGMVIRAKKKGRTTIKGTFRFADGTKKTVKISVRVK